MHHRFGTHCDVPDLVTQLTRLSNAAFAEYQGAMPVNEAFTRWYLRRPGCRPELCPAALWGDELVSNVLVALQELQIGGQMALCGIVDTVATAPEHRQRGLARRLMGDAHRLMQEAGAEMAVLYTNPDGHPYCFYGRLGYQTLALAEAVLGPRPEPAEGAAISVAPARDGDVGPIRDLLDRSFAAYDGYAPMSDALWRWHRQERPPSLPCDLLVGREAQGRVVATAAFATVDLLVEALPTTVAVVSDLACAVEPETGLRSVLAAAPAERVMAFLDVRAPEHQTLARLGYAPAIREAAMALPFTDRARNLLDRCRGPWYVMIESVVGV